LSDRDADQLPALDGLRALAIALVLWHHGPMVVNAKQALYARPFYRGSVSGWIGVDLFFVLSGFLITGILLRTRGRAGALKNFWARRALRIFPAAFLYLALLYFLVTRYHFPPAAKWFARWPTFAFYLANLDITFRGWGGDGSLDILWTLALEEQFYLVWPFVVMLLNPRRLFVACVAMAVAGPFARMWTYRALGPTGAYVATWCRVDTLAIGAALAAAYADPSLRAWAVRACRWASPAAVVTLVWLIARPIGLSYLAHNPPWLPTAGYTLLALSFAAVVGVAAADPPALMRALFANRPMRWLGRISYGVYLWHCLVGHVVRVYVVPLMPADVDFGWKLVVWFVLTVAVASLSWFAFERPLLALKARFVSARP
jgi:peptidoglycan/LPS O-acetylase OafA/YrhL